MQCTAFKLQVASRFWRFACVGLTVTGCGGTVTVLSDASDDASDARASAIVCDVPSEVAFFGGCTFSYDHCSDGRLYQVNCSGHNASPPCGCRIQDEGGLVNGNGIGQFLCASSPSGVTSVANQVCGWNITTR